MENSSKSTVFFCYGKIDPLSINGYDYVILESKHYSVPDIKKFKKLNGKVIAYISLGEVNSQATYFNLFENNTLGRNENWDSYYLNLESDSTKESLFSVIDQILSLGYDGLFLDNLDNFCSIGPQKNQRKEVVNFVELLNKKYPEHTFIQNAGLELLDDTAKNVDAIVVESVITNYTFDDRTYKLRSEEECSKYLRNLVQIRRKYKLPVILVEYADTSALYQETLQKIEKTNFLYFIGTIDLQGIPNYINQE